jgi:hypothetical protein
MDSSMKDFLKMEPEEVPERASKLLQEYLGAGSEQEVLQKLHNFFVCISCMTTHAASEANQMAAMFLAMVPHEVVVSLIATAFSVGVAFSQDQMKTGIAFVVSGETPVVNGD